MSVKRIILIVLVCLLLLPMNAFAESYGKTGASGYFNGNVGVPSGFSYYVNDVEMIKLNKFDGTAAPDENNDTDEGYKVGSNWYDVTNDKAYICLNNADGAAVWTETTAEGAGETNTASNVGSQIEIYKQKTVVDLEFRTLKADSAKVIVSNEVEGGEIDAGSTAENRAQAIDSKTAINKTNPANETGTITSVEIWANENLIDCKVATFFVVTGNNLSTRDYEAIGTVTAGSKQTFPVSIEVEASDYIGLSYSAGKIENDSTGGSGRWYSITDHIPCTDQTFSFTAAQEVSLYATGTTAVLDYVRFDVVPLEVAKEIGGLLSTTTVAFNADADTTLYTVPTGKRCVLTHAIVVAADDAGASTTLSIGANGTETDFVPANTLSNLDAQYDSVILMPIPNTTPLKIKSYAAATVIEAQVASQSGAAGNTIYLFGILY